MIKYLIKYDLKKMLSVVPYFYALSIVFAGLTRLVNVWSDIQLIFIIGQVLQGCSIAMMVNALVNTFISIIVKSFSQGLYGDESYLTHTLPVTKKEILNSKVISSIITVLITVAVCFLSLFIMFYSEEFMLGFKAFIEISISGFDTSLEVFIIALSLLVFFEILSLLLIGFTAIIKGHFYNDKKIFKSFIWFLILYAISTVANVVITLTVIAITGNIDNLLATTISAELFKVLIICELIIYFIIPIVYYFISLKLFEKGVNVD